MFKVECENNRSLFVLGSLLPSHGLPPFGANITNIAMSESLCGSSMFGGDRWSVNPMTAGKYSLSLLDYSKLTQFHSYNKLQNTIKRFWPIKSIVLFVPIFEWSLEFGN